MKGQNRSDQYVITPNGFKVKHYAPKQRRLTRAMLIQKIFTQNSELKKELSRSLETTELIIKKNNLDLNADLENITRIRIKYDLKECV